MIINNYNSKAAVLRHLKSKGYNINAGLSKPESNPKLYKNQLKGVLASPLHLSPAKISGYEVCPQRSLGCTLACLHTAGNPMFFAGKFKARLAKTKAYFEQRESLLALLAFEIQALETKATSLGMQAAVRLNATSDISWERVGLTVNGKQYKSLFDLFPKVEFYDYTKTTKRALLWASDKLPKNYHITFSRAEDNQESVKKVLKAGGNVAVVFKKIPLEYLGIPTHDGDSHDFRPLDPKGVVIALKAKGQAKTDTSGFVVQDSNIMESCHA